LFFSEIVKNFVFTFFEIKFIHPYEIGG